MVFEAEGETPILYINRHLIHEWPVHKPLTVYVLQVVKYVK